LYINQPGGEESEERGSADCQLILRETCEEVKSRRMRIGVRYEFGWMIDLPRTAVNKSFKLAWKHLDKRRSILTVDEARRCEA
jgi:hypothetical protein